MLFDLTLNEENKTVTISAGEIDKTVALSLEDVNAHSGAWLINQILSRGDSEVL